MFPDERRRLFERALDFAQRHVASPEQLREVAADPSAVSVVNRYHGPGGDLVQHLLSPEASRGRGVCSRCGHPVYFDDRVPSDQRPGTMVCLLCLGDMCVERGADLKSWDRAREQLKCPDSCPHK